LFVILELGDDLWFVNFVIVKHAEIKPEEKV
jgi:hypothetical protein